MLDDSTKLIYSFVS